MNSEPSTRHDSAPILAKSESSVPADFVCRRCGNCCQIAGEVRLDDRDINRIARFLQTSRGAFVERYTRLARDRRGLALIDGEGDRCIFLDPQNHCAINPAKPRQCRGFPRRWRNPGFEASCRGCSPPPA